MGPRGQQQCQLPSKTVSAHKPTLRQKGCSRCAVVPVLIGVLKTLLRAVSCRHLTQPQSRWHAAVK